MVMYGAIGMNINNSIVSTGGKLSVVWDGKLHNSEYLGYGADWKKDSNIIVTCSFYNHLMQLWRLVL